MQDDIKSSRSPVEQTTPGSSWEESSKQPKRAARRTVLTQNACTRCRKKKSKCDGARPTCGRCHRNGAQCTYDVAQEGVTRMQNLQQQLERSNSDHDRMMLLFNAFQHGSDELATNLLARLRLGESLESLISHLEHSPAVSTQDAREEAESREDLSQSWPSDSFAQTPISMENEPWNARQANMPDFSRPTR